MSQTGDKVPDPRQSKCGEQEQAPSVPRLGVVVATAAGLDLSPATTSDGGGSQHPLELALSTPSSHVSGQFDGGSLGMTLGT